MVNLSIIIINYKSLPLIRNCLHSIYAARPVLDFEIIIVNNDPLQAEDPQITQTYPELQWISMGYNSGFARANNEGIKRAAGEVVLLLNPDTLIPETALDRCYRNLVQSEYIACGVQLLNEDSTPQISGNYFVKGGLNYLLPLPYAGKFIKWLAGLFSLKAPHVALASSVTEVDWINGAFLMVKKEGIQKAGMMDEDFFLYAEETEWCARLKKVGRLCLFGSITVFHLQGVSANEAFSSSGKGYYNLFDRKGLQIMLSNLVRIRKQFGKFWFLCVLAIYTLDWPVFLIGILLSFAYPEPDRTYSFHQFRGFTKNLIFLWSKTPVILLNRPYFYKVL
ncbi:MAG TPA: glycosyltransferase [Puia sp.]